MAHSNEQKDIRKRFARLLAGKRHPFPLIGEVLKAPTRHGVYVVYGPRNKILAVRRTVRGRNGILQRLTDHLRGNSSFMAGHFKRDGLRLRGTCSYTYVAVKNPRKRALLESYAVGYLCPTHLGLGELI